MVGIFPKSCQEKRISHLSTCEFYLLHLLDSGRFYIGEVYHDPLFKRLIVVKNILSQDLT